jgi:hypothetical protein
MSCRSARPSNCPSRGTSLWTPANLPADVTVTVSWPQFGKPPVKASKKVRVAEHKTVTVRFNRHVTTDQILSLQSWQERHDMQDGCKYKATIVDTF